MSADRPLSHLSEPNARVGDERCQARLRVVRERPEVGTSDQTSPERPAITRWIGWCRPVGETDVLDQAASGNEEIRYEGPLEKSDGSVTVVLARVRILGKQGQNYRMKGVRPPEEIAGSR